MNLKSRVERLEAAAGPVEPPKARLVVFVPPNAPERVARGIQRIHCGEQTWLREPSETEEAFKARVLAVLPPVDPTLTGLSAVYATPHLTADYGKRDE